MNATSIFVKCHEITELWEGGWSNHPSDPGGKTMYGITEAVYHTWLKSKKLPLKPVRNITKTEAREIYYNDYWLKGNCSHLAMGVNLAVYDANVNSGVSRGKKWLASSVGGPDHETVKKICAARLSFMQSLKIWKTFGKGWARRVADIEAKGVKWALEAANQTPRQISNELASEAQSAKQKSASYQSKAQGTGVATAATGSGGTLLTPEQADIAFNWLVAGAFSAGLVALLILVSRSIIQKRRADAYVTEFRSV